MRPLARLGFATVLAGAAALVSGCDTLENMGSIFDTKTKLPGERKAVFPDGVPGVTPGVPPELVKGYHEPAADAAPPPIPGERKEAKEPKEAKEAEAQPKPKPKPKPHTVQAAAKPQQPAPTVAAQAAPPPSAPAAATAPWPAQQQQQQQPPQAAWPSAPSSGTIAR